MNFTPDHTSVRIASAVNDIPVLKSMTLENLLDDEVCLPLADAYEEAGDLVRAKRWRMQAKDRQFIKKLKTFLESIPPAAWYNDHLVDVTVKPLFYL